MKIEAAILARGKMFSIWDPSVMHNKGMKLLVKAYSVIKADRVEDAIMHENGDESTVSKRLWDRV